MRSDSRPEVLANRELWDVWTRLHQGSAFYDVDRFRGGGSTLVELERQEVGRVDGRKLLHLQCHFGLDTLSWARAGAKVTGVDISVEAIDAARALARELGLDANFVCSDLETLGDLGTTFDIVYTSFGVLSWLPDLEPWARLIARHVAPGGFFYMLEFHPVLGMFDDDGKDIAYPYFHQDEPIVSQETATYAGSGHQSKPCYQWTHSLGDVINSLVSAGLAIEFLHEFPYCLHPCYEFLVESEPGRYVMRDHPNGIPMLFSVKARAAGRTPVPESTGLR